MTSSVLRTSYRAPYASATTCLTRTFFVLGGCGLRHMICSFMMSPFQLGRVLNLLITGGTCTAIGSGRLFLGFGGGPPVVLGRVFEGGLEALTKKSEQLGRRLKFQLLARVNLLYGAFKGFVSCRSRITNAPRIRSRLGIDAKENVTCRWLFSLISVTRWGGLYPAAYFASM